MSTMAIPNMIPPFKADVVGSLLRPQAILEARAAHGAGNLTRQALRDIERAHISEAIALQKGVGLKVCTDGEYHRRHWFMDFVERIEGVAFEGGLNTICRWLRTLAAFDREKDRGARPRDNQEANARKQGWTEVPD